MLKEPRPGASASHTLPNSGIGEANSGKALANPLNFMVGGEGLEPPTLSV